MTVRVYVPASLRRLDELRRCAGGLECPSGRAFAVTDAARAAHPDADDEQLEYLAMTAAALESPARLSDSEPQRRLVLALDVDRAEPVEDEDPFAVRSARYRWPDDVAAYHLDSADAEPDVARARVAWQLQGDDWVQVVLGTAEHELGWYARGELAELLEVYAAPR